MKVCDLPRGRELHTTIDGNPFITCPPRGLRPAGYVLEVGDHVDYQDLMTVDSWLRQANHKLFHDDDPMLIATNEQFNAAISFAIRPAWPDTLPGGLLTFFMMLSQWFDGCEFSQEAYRFFKQIGDAIPWKTHCYLNRIEDV